MDVCNCSLGSHQEVEEIRRHMPSFMREHGFPIKGLACSDEPAPKELSDTAWINVGGYQWEPNTDQMKIMTPKIYIGNKKKGRFTKDTKILEDEVTIENLTNFFAKETITHAVILSKTAALYDPLSFAAPVKVFG